MSLFDVINTSATGMVANRYWLDTIAGNVANANSTQAADGGPYRRRIPVFQEVVHDAMKEIMEDDWSPEAMANDITAAVMDGSMDKESAKVKGEGVQPTGLVEDLSPMKVVYMPGHPDADAEGYVTMPNVDIVKEMVDMITAQRAYDANVQITNAAKSMINKALEIGK
ncbi:MAG: flagellar basal body rod protein FlgC [Candidatus Sericytochromatia bacterium]